MNFIAYTCSLFSTYHKSEIILVGPWSYVDKLSKQGPHFVVWGASCQLSGRARLRVAPEVAPPGGTTRSPVPGVLDIRIYRKPEIFTMKYAGVPVDFPLHQSNDTGLQVATSDGDMKGRQAIRGGGLRQFEGSFCGSRCHHY